MNRKPPLIPRRTKSVCSGSDVNGAAGPSRWNAARCMEWSVSSLLLAGMILLGCATIGRDFPYRRVAEIRIGQTTKGELLGRFGLPYRRGIEDGDSTWTYVNYKVRLFGEKLRTRDLYVRFDRDGIVRSFTYNSNMDD